MKTKAVLTILITIITINFSYAQSVEGYTHHETSKGVSLYYKQHKYGVTFRAVNKRNKYVYVKVFNVISKWTDGRIRKKDVNIGFVGAGKASNGGGLNLDNYSKIKSWSFDNWKWSEKSFNY